MNKSQSGNKTADPFEQWRGMRDAYLDVLAKAMVEGVNTEAYAKATGAMLDAYLTASSPFREALEKSMIRALEQLSMPTRGDFVSLAERFTNFEMRLDDLDVKLDRIEQAAAKPVPEAESPVASSLAALEKRLRELDAKLSQIQEALAKSARVAAQPAAAQPAAVTEPAAEPSAPRTQKKRSK
ncbi:MAG: hypothetical protein ACE14M_07250 [Terriglobales bacterium]